MITLQYILIQIQYILRGYLAIFLLSYLSYCLESPFSIVQVPEFETKLISIKSMMGHLGSWQNYNNQLVVVNFKSSFSQTPSCFLGIAGFMGKNYYTYEDFFFSIATIGESSFTISLNDYLTMLRISYLAFVSSSIYLQNQRYDGMLANSKLIVYNGRSNLGSYIPIIGLLGFFIDSGLNGYKFKLSAKIQNSTAYSVYLQQSSDTVTYWFTFNVLFYDQSAFQQEFGQAYILQFAQISVNSTPYSITDIGPAQNFVCLIGFRDNSQILDINFDMFYNQTAKQQTLQYLFPGRQPDFVWFYHIKIGAKSCDNQSQYWTNDSLISCTNNCSVNEYVQNGICQDCSVNNSNILCQQLSQVSQNQTDSVSIYIIIVVVCLSGIVMVAAIVVITICVVKAWNPTKIANINPNIRKPIDMQIKQMLPDLTLVLF